MMMISQIWDIFLWQSSIWMREKQSTEGRVFGQTEKSDIWILSEFSIPYACSLKDIKMKLINENISVFIEDQNLSV